MYDFYVYVCVCVYMRVRTKQAQGRIRSPIMDSFRSSSFPRLLGIIAAASGQGERRRFTLGNVDPGTRAIARIARTSLRAFSSVTERRVLRGLPF